MTADRTNLAPTCVNHPKVETRLTCSNCGDPICTRCMVTTAVGQKCPRCAKQSGRAKGNPEPQLLARAFGAGVAVAAARALALFAGRGRRGHQGWRPDSGIAELRIEKTFGHGV